MKHGVLGLGQSRGSGSVQVKSKLPFGPSCQILPPKRAPLEPASEPALVEPVPLRQGSARDIQRAPTKAIQARKAADRKAAGLAGGRRADSGSGGGAACAGTGSMRAPLYLKLYVCHQSQRLENPLNAPLPLPFVPELRTTMRKLFALACVAALMGCAAGMRQLSDSYDYSSTSPHCPPECELSFLFWEWGCSARDQYYAAADADRTEFAKVRWTRVDNVQR